MRIIVFGIGAFFINRQDVLLKEEIIAFVDNDKNKWDKMFYNIPIISPCHIKEFSYDKIIVMSRDKKKIKMQLMNELGIDEMFIMDFEKYCEHSVKERKLCELIMHYKRNHFYLSNNTKRILIITNELTYNGGSLTAFYAALALTQKGFNAVIVARKGEGRLINEIISKGVTVFIQELVDYCTWEQICWIEQFDYVIVNTLQQWKIIKELICRKPVFWWIHESRIEYEYLDKGIIENTDNMNIETYVVSDVALRIFRQYFNKINANILPYGIPDKGLGNTQLTMKDKVVFAVIGRIESIKAQDIFLRAITQLTKEELNESEFWLIGACPPENQYGIPVLKLVETIPEVKWLGELSREEIEKIYKDIDVVVVPSRQDSLPIVVTEAFMYGKIGIVSNVIGTVKYIEDKENGLIFESENVTDLTRKMSWVLNNKDQLNSISGKARQTYEKYFTMKVFGDRLETIIGDLQ
ncbi:glycosyltransferase family 4 protein [Lacrimispora celerecrescens]|uniref:Glycosyl transferase family 4 n=1 Tax=[Clostridium] celerecrescens 18A TaxID=1286362 RepID=A0A2M8ZCH1_9FIRM|nr:glycosyltransferase family 4 protein [Lacrimispora celerecrescens]PJJ31136.1 glycosyl transferase family 4 [[Clostridium] celerecrescens 18A]